MRDVALYLLSLPVERRIEMGDQAADYARRHFEATVVYRDLVMALHEELAGKSAVQP